MYPSRTRCRWSYASEVGCAGSSEVISVVAYTARRCCIRDRGAMELHDAAVRRLSAHAYLAAVGRAMDVQISAKGPPEHKGAPDEVQRRPKWETAVCLCDRTAAQRLGGSLVRCACEGWSVQNLQEVRAPTLRHDANLVVQCSSPHNVRKLIRHDRNEPIAAAITIAQPMSVFEAVTSPMLGLARGD